MLKRSNNFTKNTHLIVRAAAILVMGLLGAFIVFTRSEAAGLCENGAMATPNHCSMFAHFVPADKSYTDARIKNALNLKDDETLRSIAIIAGVSKYPNFEKGDLAPAETDINRLIKFFKDSQNFDEIIVLKEKDVNLTNLNYVFGSYLQKIADRYTKTRIVFAYSGHGVLGEGAASSSYIVLTDAKNDGDYDNLLSMGMIRNFFNDFAPRGHQFLALINSCFGGGVFGDAKSGGNIFKTDKPGANALTAGAPDELVYSLGGDGQGSIFFDSIVKGVDSGDATSVSIKSDANGNQTTVRRNVIALGNLLGYLTEEVDRINASNSLHYSTPWQGSVMPSPLVSQGGFFFLAGQGRRPASFDTTIVPPGPVSSIVGRPDLKIFNPPVEYSVRGIDVSSFSGEIDWSKIAKASIFREKIDFAYMRATMGANRTDKSFKANWTGSSAQKLARGAYHVYDFCDDPFMQAEHLRSIVGVTLEQMPIGVDLEYYVKSKDAWQIKQVKCVRDKGMAQTRKQLMTFLDKTAINFGKKPVIFGNSEVFKNIIDINFISYSIWLHDYTDGKSGTQLPGSNPWTLWQFTNSQRVDGASKPIDASVFFGDKDQFAAFVQTGRNISFLSSRNQ